jgi:hypothetical protein
MLVDAIANIDEAEDKLQKVHTEIIDIIHRIDNLTVESPQDILNELEAIRDLLEDI